VCTHIHVYKFFLSNFRQILIKYVGPSVYQRLACECIAGRDATNFKDKQPKAQDRANGKVSISDLQRIYLINKHGIARKLKDVCKHHMDCETLMAGMSCFCLVQKLGNIILMRLV
jgi:hypothetical protein